MSEQRAEYSVGDRTPRDKNGNTIGIGDILVVRVEDKEWRYKALAIDTLQGSGSVQVECLDQVEPGFERRWVSRWDLWMTYEIETKAVHEVDDIEEPFEERLPDPRFEETGDYSENVKQSRMEFPHFQEVEGKKRVTLFTLELNTGDMRHTIEARFGELVTHLNAHDTLRLIEWLSSHKSEVALLSRLLNEAAMSEDMADMQRISYEWQQYKHTDARGLGDETGPLTPRQSDQG